MSWPTNHQLPPPPTALPEKIAQLIMVRIGSNLPPIRTVEQDEPRVAQLLERCPVGGLLLFNGGSETASTLSRLQAISQVPLLVGADIERGVGQQVKGCTLFPHAMAFGRLPEHGAIAMIHDFAHVLAREAHQVGIHVAFGPVADVNTNPRNPIIATRAFGEDPQLVAQLVGEYVKTVQALGLLTTAKHFPGHGHTDRDSHDTLPIVQCTWRELEQCELVPFRAAFEAGCGLVMTAHVAYPALDPAIVPATLSPTILRQLLREEMGFAGAVCSDSLLMAGVRNRFQTEGETALAALQAGVDLLLDLDDPATVVDYLCQCVSRGKLPEERIDDALHRLWKLKQFAWSQETFQQFARHASQRIACGALTVMYGADSSFLPFKPHVPLTAILLKPFESPLEPPEQPLAAALRERFRDVRYVQLGPNAETAKYDLAHQMAANAQQLLVAVIVRPAAWHAFGLRPEQSDFVRQLLRMQPAVLVSLGVPCVLEDFPEAAVGICTYSDVPVSQVALAESLLR